MSSDMREKKREAQRRFRESNRESINARSRERMRAERATPKGRLRDVYCQRAFKARKKEKPGAFGTPGFLRIANPPAGDDRLLRGPYCYGFTG